MRITALAITTVAAASLLLGACASTGTDTTAGRAGETGADAPRVAAAGGTSKTFDCDNGTSLVATYDDPAYNGATSIAMQAGGATPSSNMQVSLGEDTATLTDGASTVDCRARQ